MAELKAQQIKDLITWTKQVRDARAPYEAGWKEQAEYLLPNREIIMGGIDQKGKTTCANVFNGSPIHALQLLSNGILGYTCGPNYRWKKYRMADRKLNEISEVKRFLQEVEEQMYYELHQADFYVAMAQYIRDAATIMGGMYVGENLAEQELEFAVRHPWELYVSRDHRGKVDGVIREYWMKARQAAEYFGKENLPDTIKYQLEKHLEQDYKFLHILVPRKYREHGVISAVNKPIASIYIYEPESKEIKAGKGTKAEKVAEGGYDEMPLIIWPWDMSSGEDYPRTPASNSIKDVKMLSQQSRSLLVAGQKAVNPPFWLPLEQRGYIDLNPGGRNWAEGEVFNRPPVPLLDGVKYPVGEDIVDKWTNIVNQHYYVDFFLMLQQQYQTGKAMTATQVIELMGEKAAVLVAVTMNEQYSLDKILGRSFNLSYRAGRMPKAPDILLERGSQMKVEYLGPLAMAQRRLFKSQGIRRSIEAMLPIFQIAPQTTDKFNWDEIAEDLADGDGMPEKNIRSDEEVEEIRRQRAAALQQQAEAEQLEKVGKAMPGLSKKPEAGSPIERLTEAQLQQAG